MSKATAEADPVRLGHLLELHREDLIGRWCHKVANLSPALARLPHASLVDAMGLFVDMVIADLRGIQMPDGSAVARHHGEHRKGVSAGLQTLIHEYVCWLDVVKDLLDELGETADVDAWRRIARSALLAASEAAHAYAVRQHRESRARDAERFAFLAHDLRNPLASVRNAWALMAQRGELPSGRLTEVIDRSLDRVVARLDTSLHAMRTRVESDHDVYTLERIDITQLAAQICSELELEANSRGIALELNATESIPAELHAPLATAAIANVLHNAIKHAPEGSTVTIEVSKDGGHAQVEISDEGPGLAPDLAERIYRAFQSGRGESSGFGLGLAIVQHAMDAHRGSVHVTNREATGCCFLLLFPVTREAPEV